MAIRAFDLPTQIGYDSDMDISAGEGGKVGVAIDTVEEIKRLFDGIDLAAVSTSMTIKLAGRRASGDVHHRSRGTGSGRQQAQGTIQNDILKEYLLAHIHFPAKAFP